MELNNPVVSNEATTAPLEDIRQRPLYKHVALMALGVAVRYEHGRVCEVETKQEYVLM